MTMRGMDVVGEPSDGFMWAQWWRNCASKKAWRAAESGNRVRKMPFVAVGRPNQ